MMNSDKISTKHWDEWAKDKNPLLALSAVVIAGLAEEYIEMFEMIMDGGEVEENIRLPKLGSWLRMYHSRENVFRGIVKALKDFSKDGAEVIDFYEGLLKGLKKFKKLTQEEKKKLWTELDKKYPGGIQEMVKEFHELIKRHKEFIVEDIVSERSARKKEARNETRKNKRPLRNRPEIIFFVRVFFPCFFRYGTYINDLLREAQHGNAEALEKLITLDRSAIFEKKISEIVHQEQTESEQPKLSKIIKAFKELQRATKKSEMKEAWQRQNLRKSIKYSLGGLISLISVAMKQKIEAKEIYNLFDYIACIKNGKIDPDFINVKPDTFGKQINRHRDFWHNIIPLADR